MHSQSDESGNAPIIAYHGKISIINTNIISYDETLDGPDERLEDRAYIAALSSENNDQTKVWESRMDVNNSEISYLGNEGDYHNDVSELATPRMHFSIGLGCAVPRGGRNGCIAFDSESVCPCEINT